MTSLNGRVDRLEARFAPIAQAELVNFASEAEYMTWLADPEREQEPLNGLRSVYIGIDLDKV